MDMDTFTVAALLLFITGGVNTQVLEPKDKTVLQNSDARFNCSVKAPGWTVMSWTVNGFSALSIAENSGPIGSQPNYSVTNYSTAAEYKWEFLIKRVRKDDAGFVGCQVQNSQVVRATLTVQQNGTVAIAGSNRTATEGDQVTFQCLAAGWSPAANISWAVSGTPVDQGLYTTNQSANGNLMNSNSTLKITAKANVSVDCLASISTLPSPEISTVFLTVYKAVPRDQTVLIAIVVAFSLAALLVLLIIGIIFCCKRRRRKRSSYQDEVRARSLPRKQQATYTERGRVQENFGYAEDSPRAEVHDGVYTISSFQHANYMNNIQHPEENSNRYTYNGSSFDYHGLQKHRHLTIV